MNCVGSYWTNTIYNCAPRASSILFWWVSVCSFHLFVSLYERTRQVPWATERSAQNWMFPVSSLILASSSCHRYAIPQYSSHMWASAKSAQSTLMHAQFPSSNSWFLSDLHGSHPKHPPTVLKFPTQLHILCGLLLCLHALLCMPISSSWYTHTIPIFLIFSFYFKLYNLLSQLLSNLLGG